MRTIQGLTTLDEALAEEMKDTEFAAGYAKVNAATDFAVELARAREARHLTQAQLSELTGIKQPTLSRIERGRVPELPSLLKIGAALNARITFEPTGKASIALM